MAAGEQVARAEARRVRALAAFARSRPAAMFDRAPGERGAASAASVAARPAALTDVSEWAVDEAAATLGVSGRAASLLLIDAVTLVEGLPATLAALSAGDISPAHARVDGRGRRRGGRPGEARARWRRRCCPRAAGQTAPALRAAVRRAVARIDAAAAADRLAKAVRDRHVRLDARDDGMSTLTALLTTPVGRACHEALSAYAKACEFDEDGNRDPRTHEQRMADCLADLILRPHADHPAVRVVLTLIAGVDTVTGQGDGCRRARTSSTATSCPRHRCANWRTSSACCRGPSHRATAATDVRTPATPAGDDGARRRADAADSDRGGASTRPGSLRCATRNWPRRRNCGRLRRGDRQPEREAGGGSATRAALTRLLDTRRLIDTALAERPRIAVVDQLSGTLLALTDSTELRAAAAAGRGLGPPSGTDAYQPTDPLYRFVRLRDRRCRFPGCRLRARCCDLDHQVPHPHGRHAHDNLACLCEHHHRLSHQAPGWRLHRDADGGLVWTLPGGRTITTYPPAFGSDDGNTRVRHPRHEPAGSGTPTHSPPSGKPTDPADP